MQFPSEPTTARVSEPVDDAAAWVNTNVRAARAKTTVHAYAADWKMFTKFCRDRGLRAFPAEPYTVAQFLSERAEYGWSVAYIQRAAAAIAATHVDAGEASPTTHPGVRRTMAGITRRYHKPPKQAKALVHEDFKAIVRSACRPRQRGFHMERSGPARQRGFLEIALVATMRDAMLRPTEAANLLWTDVDWLPDGTGRLLIRQSKTDQMGEGAVMFLTKDTVRHLKHLGGGIGTVFRLADNKMVSKVIQRTTAAAGLGAGYSGHSARIGMAIDLCRRGCSLPAIMQAGRWKSAQMVAYYLRNEIAAQGAVARYFGDGE